MEIRRIVPNISSDKMEASKKFYKEFLGLKLVMDMEWILTFASPSNETAQISIVKKDKPNVEGSDITISIEVNEIDALYKKAVAMDYKIPYPITNESWSEKIFCKRSKQYCCKYHVSSVSVEITLFTVTLIIFYQ